MPTRWVPTRARRRDRRARSRRTSRGLARNLVDVALGVMARIASLPRAGVAGYKRVMTDGLAVTYGEGRAEERRRAFEQYRALPESFFASMRRAAGLTPRARL